MKDFSKLAQTFHNIATLNRKNVPERVTHTKGYGAYGKFTVTYDVSKYTLANFLQPKNVTRVFVRFSNYKGEKGFPDTLRNPKGIAIKFYTSEGNFDLTANSIPVFFIREPALFPEFLQSQKRNPKTNLFEPEDFWCFFAKYPQSLHALLFYFSERGIPRSLRHAHYYSCNALKFYTESKEFFVKFHIKTIQGIKNLSPSEAEELAGIEPDFYGKDLYDSIEKGDFPKWKIYFQFITPEQIQKFSFNPFDATKVWSQKEFPLQELGILELNENPKDYLEEVEKSAFSPNNLVKGIELSPDPILQMRAFVYSDAQRYRLGVNYEQLEVNKTQSKFYGNFNEESLNLSFENGKNGKFLHFNNSADDDYFQPRIFLKNLTELQKKALVLEIAKSLSQASEVTQAKILELLSKLDFLFSENIKVQISTCSSDLLHDLQAQQHSLPQTFL